MNGERGPGKSRANDGDAPRVAGNIRLGCRRNCGVHRSMASGLHTLQYPNAAVTASIPYGYEIGYADALFLARPVSFPSPELFLAHI
jgi:hypothetical protein